MNNNIIEKIQKETNYSFTKILSLIIKDNFKYGITLEEFYNYKFYKIDDKYKSSYITIKKNKKLIKKYNNKNSIYKVKNKNILYNIFKEYVNRDYMMLDDENIVEFSNFIKGKEKIIVSKIDGYECQELSLSNCKTKNLYLSLFSTNIRMIQESMKEQKDFKKFGFKSKHSINFIVLKNKIIQETLYYDKKYYIIIDGKFKNKKIPLYDELKKEVLKIKSKLKDLNYLYFEFFISNKGIELLSINPNVPIIQNEESLKDNKSYYYKIKE